VGAWRRRGHGVNGPFFAAFSSVSGLHGGGESGVPGFVPTGAIGFADFRTGASGNYWDGTAAVTADEMFISDPTNYSVTFDSSTLTASGLPGGDATAESNFTKPGGTIQGLLGAAMLNGCQLVATFTRAHSVGGNDGNGIVFDAYDAPNYNTDWQCQSDDSETTIRDYEGEDGTISADAAATNGTTKFAVEINPGTSLSASVNGSAPISTTATVGVDGDSNPAPINQISFVVNSIGIDPANTCFLETLAVYPVGYAALDTLSA
jgi:hypothetical protein